MEHPTTIIESAAENVDPYMRHIAQYGLDCIHGYAKLNLDSADKEIRYTQVTRVMSSQRRASCALCPVKYSSHHQRTEARVIEISIRRSNRAVKLQ